MMAAQSSGITMQATSRTPIWGSVLFPKLSAMWTSGIGCDLTIVCQDGSLRAPSILLSSLSDKLHRIIQLSRDKVLTFMNINVKFWDELLFWVYAGAIPEHLLNEDSLPTLFSSLLVAHSLGMYDVLALYKHLATIDNHGKGVSDVWKSFDPDVGVDIHLEYFSVESNSIMQATFTSENLRGVKEYLYGTPKVSLYYGNTTKLNITELCGICNQNCQAGTVQCFYCREILSKYDGRKHMDEKHKFSPSTIWPYTCDIQQTRDSSCVKGGRVAILNGPKMRHNFQYQCKLCSYTTNSSQDVAFIDHFLTHGFFPEICCHCGDVFFEYDIKKKHEEYCGSHPVEFQDPSLRKNEQMENLDESESELVTDVYGDKDSDMSTGEEYNITPDISKVVKQEECNGYLPKKCILCADKCKAQKVMCLYCNDIVDNDVAHMEQEHGQCKKAQIWAFTCNVQGKEKMELVIKKITGEDGHVHYECQRCSQVLKERKMVTFHMRSTHRVSTVYFCRHCDCGFRTATSRSGHEHLCGGGNYIQCRQCSLCVGNVEQMNMHMQQMHKNIKGSLVNKNPVKKISTTRKTLKTNNSNVEIEMISKDIKSGDGLKPHSVVFKMANAREEKKNPESEVITHKPLCYSCGVWCKAERVKCIYCYKVVKNDPSHMKSAHPYTPTSSNWVYTCKFLSKVLANQADWMVSYKVPTEKSCYYQCAKCPGTFKTLSDTKSHLKNDHQTYMKECEVCESGFGGYIYHKDHQHFCSGGLLVNCDSCNRVAGCHKSLLDHNSKYHPDLKAQKKNKVNNCNEINSVDENSSPDLNVDKLKQSDLVEVESEWQNMCYSCGKDCKPLRVKCIYCYKDVANDGSHMEICHPYTPKTSMWVFTCKFLKSSDARTLVDWVVFNKEHSRNSGKEFQYNCTKCEGRTFRSVESIVTHVTKVHQILPKVCEVCETGFTKFAYLKDHHHFCSGGKLLKCGICDKMVGCYKVYSYHMTKVHPGLAGTKKAMLSEVTGSEFIANKSLSEDESESEEINDDDYQKPETGRQYLCLTCGTNCKSRSVKCMYCFKVVDNDQEHMDIIHPYTPETSSWVFNCRYENDDNIQPLVSCQEPTLKEVEGTESNKDDMKKTKHKSQYRCITCSKCYHSTTKILSHLAKRHKINEPKFCDVCSSVFNSEYHWKDHCHYCSGGQMLKCDICNAIVGGHEAMENHSCPKNMHRKGKQSNHKPSSKTEDSDDGSTSNENKSKRVTRSSKKQIPFKSVIDVKTEPDGDEDEELLDATQEENSDTDEYDVPSKSKVKIQRPNIKITIPKNNDKDRISRLSRRRSQYKRKPKPKHVTTQESRLLTAAENFTDLEMQDVFVEVKTAQFEVENPKRCFTCGDNCTAETLKCAYCNQVVNCGDYNHMEVKHPAMPKNIIWAVNCTYFDKDSQSPIISELYTVDESAENNKMQLYHCKICNELYKTTGDLTLHTRNVHKFSICFCKVCSAGFKYPAKRRSHQQFCDGGDILKCILCDRLIGNWICANAHYYGLHKQGMPKRKGSEGGGRSTTLSKKFKRPTADHASLNEDFERSAGDDVFVEMTRARNRDHIKVCLVCDENCTAQEYRCFYCGNMVNSDDEDEHMKNFHPFTPTTSLWPMKCTMLHQGVGPYVVAITKPLQDNENNFVYSCQMCEITKETQKDIAEHVDSVHQAKCFFCKQCGLGLRTKHFKLEHQHFCMGNDIVKCVVCNISIGGWHNASSHRSTYHPAIDTPGKRRPNLKNFTLLEELEKGPKGPNGYEILCADCMGPCSATMVKCGLCNEVVQADDIHMKMKHPYTPHSTWIVYCRCSVGATGRSLVDLIGERVPIEPVETLLKENCIPSQIPYHFRCNQCHLMTAENSMLVDHIKFAHLEKDTLFTCNTCGAMVAKRKDLHMNHSHFCSQGTLFKCHVCGQLAGSRKKLMYHILTNHRKETKSEKLQSMSTGKDDIRIPEGVQLQCAECEYATPLLSKLRKHNKVVHQYKICQLYQICRFCFKVFRLRSERERHEQHIHLEDQRVLCEICGKSFEIPLQQERHIKYVHKGGREILSLAHKYHKEKKVCPQCGNMYRTTSALNKHIQTVHEQRMDFVCKYCNKRFSCSANLKVHEDRHLGVKKFNCPYCPYKAYRGNNVNEHVVKHHKGKDRPYKRQTVFPPSPKPAVNMISSPPDTESSAPHQPILADVSEQQPPQPQSKLSEQRRELPCTDNRPIETPHMPHVQPVQQIQQPMEDYVTGLPGEYLMNQLLWQSNMQHNSSYS